MSSAYPNKNREIHAFFILILLAGIFAFGNLSLAGNFLMDSAGQEPLSEFQKEARSYRQKGMDYQGQGELEIALDFYQKAVVLDPSYAVAYNDLGVVYEAFGQTERAEDAYLRAAKIDPGLLSVYSNLAMFYESRRDLRKAADYWEKRVDMGFADDPWTRKARERYDEIEMVLYGKQSRWERANRQKEAMALHLQVTKQKNLEKKISPAEESRQYYQKVLSRSESEYRDDKAVGSGPADAAKYFERAKALYANGDDVAALKAAVDAQYLDPSNKQISEFVDQVQHKVLTR